MVLRIASSMSQGHGEHIAVRARDYCPRSRCAAIDQWRGGTSNVGSEIVLAGCGVVVKDPAGRGAAGLCDLWPLSRGGCEQPWVKLTVTKVVNAHRSSNGKAALVVGQRGC